MEPPVPVLRRCGGGASVGERSVEGDYIPYGVLAVGPPVRQLQKQLPLLQVPGSGDEASGDRPLLPNSHGRLRQYAEVQGEVPGLQQLLSAEGGHHVHVVGGSLSFRLGRSGDTDDWIRGGACVDNWPHYSHGAH